MNPLTLIKNVIEKPDTKADPDQRVDRMAEQLPRPYAESLRAADRYSVENEAPGASAPSYL